MKYAYLLITTAFIAVSGAPAFAEPEAATQPIANTNMVQSVPASEVQKEESDKAAEHKNHKKGKKAKKAHKEMKKEHHKSGNK